MCPRQKICHDTQLKRRSSRTHSPGVCGDGDGYALFCGLLACACEFCGVLKMSPELYSKFCESEADVRLWIPLRPTDEEEDPEKAQKMEEMIVMLREVSRLVRYASDADDRLNYNTQNGV